jgi:hypothetical protein
MQTVGTPGKRETFEATTDILKKLDMLHAEVIEVLNNQKIILERLERQ